MQAIAAENNLAETAFFVKTAPGAYDLRWFTPNSEVDLCGHATLASAHVIFRFLDPGPSELRFQTRSGELKVGRGDSNGHVMSLPSASSEPFTPPAGFAERLAKALGAPRTEGISFLRQRWRRRGRADRGVEFPCRHQGAEAHRRSGSYPA